MAQLWNYVFFCGKVDILNVHLKFWGTLAFCGATDNVFWISDNVCLRSQNQGSEARSLKLKVY